AEGGLAGRLSCRRGPGPPPAAGESQPAVLLEDAGSAGQGPRAGAGRDRPARRVLRLRRQLLRHRRGGLGQDGLRPRPRLPPPRGRIHRLGRHVLPAAREGCDRPPEATAEGRPHRPDFQRRSAMTRPVDPEGRAARFIALKVHEATHDRLVWGMRQNRDKAVAGVPEWEKLRELASQIKEHTLTHLDEYLEQFEANATKLGTHVHWARDAAEHNAVVHDILHAHRVKSLIKSKSMLQEECGMTPYLQKRGIEVTESDLGERIQQLSNDPPTPIVVPP